MMELSFRSNLNRSLSAPDISLNAHNEGAVLRRIYMEEYMINDYSQKPLLRQITCQELSGSGNLVLNKQFTSSIDYPGYFDKSKSMNCLRRVNMDDSPMEIDDNDEVFNVSNHSDVKIDSPPPQSSTPHNLQGCTIRYRGRMPILIKETNSDDTKEVPAPVKKPKRKIMYSLVVILFIILLGIPYYDKYYYTRTIDLLDLNRNLLKHVINQDAQISQIIDILRVTQVPTLTMMSFIGATGVGKTYIASFIKRSYKPTQVYDIDINQYNINELSFYRNVPYLLLLDNLKITDIDNVATILDTIPANKTVLAITIFNIQDTEDHIVYTTNTNLLVEIPEKFITARYKTHPVIFNTITRDVVRENINIITEVHSDEINALVEEHDFKTFGFKGFHAKVALLVKNKLRTT